MAIVTDVQSPDFNSYGDAAGLVDFAAARGITIQLVDAPALLNQAMDYLNLQTWRGVRASVSQPLAWPRSGIIIDGVTYPDDVIPGQLIHAQYLLAMEAKNGALLQSTIGKQTIEERVEGAVTVRYSEASLGASPSFPWLRLLLNGLLGFDSSGLQFDVRRG